jgi:hypothetical protein
LLVASVRPSFVVRRGGYPSSAPPNPHPRRRGARCLSIEGDGNHRSTKEVVT